MLRDIHGHCFRNQEYLQKAEKIFCMSCLNTFAPNDIKDWIEEITGNLENTALCPRCSTDSLVSEIIPGLNIKITPELLIALHVEFFE